MVVRCAAPGRTRIRTRWFLVVHRALGAWGRQRSRRVRPCSHRVRQSSRPAGSPVAGAVRRADAPVRPKPGRLGKADCTSERPHRNGAPPVFPDSGQSWLGCGHRPWRVVKRPITSPRCCKRRSGCVLRPGTRRHRSGTGRSGTPPPARTAAAGRRRHAPAITHTFVIVPLSPGRGSRDGSGALAAPDRAPRGTRPDGPPGGVVPAAGRPPRGTAVRAVPQQANSRKVQRCSEDCSIPRRIRPPPDPLSEAG